MKESAILFAACVVLASGAHAASQPSDRMVSIGSHRLQMHVEGSGTPVLVIDAGERARGVFFEMIGSEHREMFGGSARALAGKSTRGRFALADGSSLFICLDASDLAAESVLPVVRETRSHRPKGGPR